MHNITSKTKSIKTKTRKIKPIRKKGSVMLPNDTLKDVNELSQQINAELNSVDNSMIITSYSPSINDQLVSLKSIPRDLLVDCNNSRAFSLKEPLEISINNKCYPYGSKEAKTFLLKNLAANKHIQLTKIVPPIQALGNCWFNTMFVTLFVSDKGRKFFHFFRQLMIEGKRADGSAIPKKLRNGLALLNYAIESCLQGTEFAYKMDTNVIIKEIFKNIPSVYKDNLPYITNIKDAGNPIRYYGSLIYYLHDKSIQLAFVSSATDKWKAQTIEQLKAAKANVSKPHVIILEFFDDESKTVTNKPLKFSVEGAKYVLDSCIIRNTKAHHFSSLLTCEKKELAYDGMSFHRLVPFLWKRLINTDFVWKFEGSTDDNGAPLEWNFKSGYQMLVYYRTN
jgi:hypothetical protein